MMPYDFDRVPNRRNPARSNKWNYYPPDVLPMWVADMDFPAPGPVLDALHQAVDHGVLGYELPPVFLQQTVAARMQRLYGWKVAPEAIIATTGIVSAFNVAARAFCTPKRGYLVQTPVYNEFHEIRNNWGFRQYNAPLARSQKGNILTYDIDWDAFEKQVKRSGLFLLCNPHNPVGKVFKRKDLARMAALCLENDVIMASDEIHSELLLDNQRFTPLARLSSEIARRTLTMVAPSKAFNVPGLFCGFAIIPHPGLRERYTKVIEHLRMHVNSMGLVAAQAAFSGECDGWLAALRQYLTSNRDFLIGYVKEYLPEVRITIPSATYLAWLDCSELVKAGRIHGSPFEFFLQEAKVAFSDGRIFGAGHQDFVRLNFGCPRSTLLQGLEQVRRSLYG
jgi:cystathionine beta-lyase